MNNEEGLEMKNLHSEKGNTLVTSLMVLIIATVIALTLMSLSMNGLTRNQHRESLTQAGKQAENGLQHITLEIQSKLQNILESDEFQPKFGDFEILMKHNFNTKFNEILSSYLCMNTNKLTNVSTDKSYSVCLDDDSYVNEMPNLLKDLVFISTGTAYGESETLQFTYTMGVEYLNYPNFLNYAVTTHDEGTLILTGGIDIQGNVRADGNIVVSEYGYAPVIDKQGSTFRDIQFNTSPWKKTVFPSIKGSSTGPATLLVNPDKKLFKMNNDRFQGGCTRSLQLLEKINGKLNNIGNLLNLNISIETTIPYYVSYYDLINTDFNTNTCIFDIHETSQANDFLSNSEKPNIYTTPVANSIDVAAIVEEGKNKLASVKNKNFVPYKMDVLGIKVPALMPGNFTASTPTEASLGIGVNLLSGGTLEGSIKIPAPYIISVGKHTLNGEFYFKNSKLNLYDGSLSNEINNTLLGNYYFEDYQLLDTLSITGGKQYLDGQFYIENSGNDFGLLGGLLTDNFFNALDINGGNHTLKGVYYIDGDVDIFNSTISADAVLFVDGDVHIKHSQIKSLGESGSLIIFATGNIIYNYTSELGANIGKEFYNKEPLELNAYLYSNSKIEIHGTLSNIHIKGGVAANQILLSGVRGDVKNELVPTFVNPEDANAKSRLIIEYDENVVQTIKEITQEYNKLVQYNELELQPIKEIKREIL